MSEAHSTSADPRRLALTGALGIGLLGLGVAVGRGTAPEQPPPIAQPIDAGPGETGEGPARPAADLGSASEGGDDDPVGDVATAWDRDTASGYRRVYELDTHPPRVRAEAALLLHHRFGPSATHLAAARDLLAASDTSSGRVAGLLALVDGDHDAALAKLGEDPDDPRATLYRAWALLEQGEAAAALDLAAALADARPEDRGASLTALQARFALDRADGLAAMREAVARWPDYPALLDALIHAARGHAGEGALDGSSEEAERMLRRADLAAAEGRRREAARLRDRALASDDAALDTAPGSGFPAFDPAREQVLFGQLPGLTAPVEAEAATLGAFTVADGLLTRAEDEPASSGFWLAEGPGARISDGVARFRVVPGNNPDLGLMFRVSAPAGWNADQDSGRPGSGDAQAMISGYSLTFTPGRVRLTRWDRGVAKSMADSVRISALSDMTRVEVVVYLVGPQIVANVYAGQRLDLVASLAARDTTHVSGALGWRAGPKQRGGGVELIASMDTEDTGDTGDTEDTGDTSRAAPGGVGQGEGHGRLYLRGRDEDATPFGSTRYAYVPEAELGELPRELRRRAKGEADEDGQAHAVLELSTVEAERLRRLPVRTAAIDGTAPWAVFDEPYRSHKDQPPSATQRGFELGLSYKNPQMVEDLLRAYHERYPEISALVEIGRTHQGRPLWALEISDNPGADEDEPAVLFDGEHHGEELLSTEYVLDLVAELLEGYGRDGRVTRWVDELDIWCVPQVNPDGAAMFMDVSTWAGRKNGHDGDGDGHLDPFEGVDLNRNYPFGWGRRGSGSAFTSTYYRGPEPGSEPETQALVALANEHHFAAAISFHTLGRAIFVPYLVDDAPEPRPNVAEVIALELVAAAPEQRNGRPYVVRPNGYPVAGSDQDWHMYAHGTAAYVLEGAYQNPALNIRDDAVINTRPVWRTLLERVRSGPRVSGHVVDGEGQPVEATVVVEELELRAGERWTSRVRDGRFDRLLASGGRYTVYAEAGGERSPSQTVRVFNGPVEVELALP